MANEDVVFRRGPASTMPSNLVPGTLLVQTDTHDVFLDDTATSRIQLGDSTKLPLTGGTLTGNLNLGGHRLYNIATPTDSTDAATKGFVDTAFQTLESELAASLSGYLPLKGGTMSGQLNMDSNRIIGVADPVSDTDASNKSYVDSKLTGLGGSYLPLSGGTLTGQLHMSSNRITNVATPTEENDAATKAYVDSQFAGSGTGDFLSSGIVPMTGNLQMGSHKIVNLATPTENSDAANKTYVDTKISEVISNADSTYAPISHTHTATQLTGLTADRALISNSAGNPAVSSVTSTELGYLDGVTSNIQTQLNAKAASAHTHDYLPLTGGELSGNLTIERPYHIDFGNATVGDFTDSSHGLYINCSTNSYSTKVQIDVGPSGSSKSLSLNVSEMTMGSRRIREVIDPATAQDVATKNYVDSQVSSGGKTYTGTAPISVSDTTISHSTSAGYKHIPAGGSTNQYLKYLSSGTAVWASITVDDGVLS